MPTDDTSSVWDRYRSGEYYAFRLLAFAAAFVFGMAMFRLTPWAFASELHSGPELFRSLGIGLAGLVLVPVVLHRLPKRALPLRSSKR